MALWRKPLQFINVLLANRSPMSVADRGPGRMTYAKKKTPKNKAVSAEVRIRERWYWRQLPCPMSHASIAYQTIKFTIYKLLP